VAISYEGRKLLAAS